MWQQTSPNCYQNTNAKIPRIELQVVSTYFGSKSDLSTCEILDAGGGKYVTIYSGSKLPTFGKNLRPPASIFDSSRRQCILRTRWSCKSSQIVIPQAEVKYSNVNVFIWCDFNRASSLICGNKMPTRCNRGFYCRSYCLINTFRAPLCPSSGAQEYYTVVAACGISCCGFQVAGLVWS